MPGAGRTGGQRREEGITGAGWGKSLRSGELVGLLRNTEPTSSPPLGPHKSCLMFSPHGSA